LTKIDAENELTAAKESERQAREALENAAA